MARIDRVAYGEIDVKGKTYYSDVVLWWDGTLALLEKTHIVDLDLLTKLLKKDPEDLVIGRGLEGTVKIAPNVRELLKRKNVHLFIETTENAAEVYNGLLDEGKHVVALMHVTL